MKSNDRTGKQWAICLIAFILVATRLSADSTHSKIPGLLGQFIPDGYSILDTASGDLNLDPYPDYIMVLKKDGEDSTSDIIYNPEKRPLLILIGQENGVYRIIGSSNSAIYCVNCGGASGDPFRSVTISKGQFELRHIGGSESLWQRNTVFKYSPDDNFWFLSEDKRSATYLPDLTIFNEILRTEKDFGRISFDEFSVYKDY